MFVMLLHLQKYEDRNPLRPWPFKGRPKRNPRQSSHLEMYLTWHQVGHLAWDLLLTVLCQLVTYLLTGCMNGFRMCIFLFCQPDYKHLRGGGFCFSRANCPAHRDPTAFLSTSQCCCCGWGLCSFPAIHCCFQHLRKRLSQPRLID